MKNYIKHLEENYKKNFNLFKKYAPALYEAMLTEDNSYSLEVSELDINISKNGELVYPYENVREYFNEYFDAYVKRNKLNLIEFDIGILMNDYSLEEFGLPLISLKYHKAQTENYLQHFKKLPDISKLDPYHKDRFAMLVFGIGVGYHIPKLSKEYNIEQLVLVEESYEMLKASFYTLDWESIFNYYLEPKSNRSIEFIIDKNPNQLHKKIATYFINKNPLAYYNLAQYISYDSSTFRETIKILTTAMKLYTGGSFGFYDDEKWSLQHTLHNVKEGYPVLKINEATVDKKKHAFLVANGPSLDKYIEVIRGKRKNIVLFACGSAISSLYKYGIKPDYLVNIERTIDVYEAIVAGVPDKEWLKDITLIAMNNLHPKVFTLFNDKFLFFKVNDAGAKLFKELTLFPALSFTNPGVANAALRVVLFLGFENISLFGMDFGYKSEQEHHSKNSMYFNKDGKFYMPKISEHELQVKGEDGDIILTDRFYNDCRKNIESLISLAENDENVDAKIYNFSHGAKIEGTINANENSEYLKSIMKLSKEEKKDILSAIKSQTQTIEVKSDSNTFVDVIEDLDIVISYLDIIKNDNLTAYSFLKVTNFVWQKVYELFKNREYFLLMYKGTFLMLLMKGYTYVAFQKQDENTKKYLCDTIDLVINYTQDVKESISNIETYIDRPF